MQHKLPVGEAYVKIASIPKMIIFDRRGRLKMNAVVRFRDAIHGSAWQTGIVKNIDPLRLIRR